MALTHTLTGLRAALDALNDAAAGEATQTAYKAYVLTYAGVAKRASADGGSVDMPTPDEVLRSLNAIGSLSASASDSKRRGRFRTSF